MAKPARSKKVSKPAPKSAKRSLALAGKKAARPMGMRKLGTGGTDPPAGGN